MSFDWCSASPEERRTYVADVVRDERAVQGLPTPISDPVVLDRVARLFAVPAIPVGARTPPTPRASAGAGSTEDAKEATS